MPKGPLGGPRPFTESKLKYIVSIKGDTSLSRDPPDATEAFTKRVNSPQSDAFEFIVKQIGNVILAVNNLRHPNKAVLHNFEIARQGGGAGLSKDETMWEAHYVISGSGHVGEAAEHHTSSRAISDLHTVLIEGEDKPIRVSAAVKSGTFDEGPFDIYSVSIEAD